MVRPTTETGGALAIEREGWARALAHRLTGKTDPNVVQLLYDWEVQAAAHGGTERDPFNFRHHGHDYKSKHAAMVGSAHMLRSARFQTVTKDLQGGFTNQAHNDLGRMGIRLSRDPLPVPLNELGNTITPKGNWADRVPAPIADAAQAIESGGISSFFGGLSSGVVLVILAVVLVVLLKK